MPHYNRNLISIMNAADPLRQAVGLPLGLDGEFFTGDCPGDPYPPSPIPTIKCPWSYTLDETGRITHITCTPGDEEAVHVRVEWLKYLLGNFFISWSYVLSGVVRWRWGEESGAIVLRNNILYSGPDRVIRFETTV
jgi:hypothetical protein